MKSYPTQIGTIIVLLWYHAIIPYPNRESLGIVMVSCNHTLPIKDSHHIVKVRAMHTLPMQASRYIVMVRDIHCLIHACTPASFVQARRRLLGCGCLGQGQPMPFIVASAGALCPRQPLAERMASRQRPGHRVANLRAGTTPAVVERRDRANVGRRIA
jgi:hypothetical protein